MKVCQDCLAHVNFGAICWCCGSKRLGDDGRANVIRYSFVRDYKTSFYDDMSEGHELAVRREEDSQCLKS